MAEDGRQLNDQQQPIKWEFDPHVPTDDFFGDVDLDDRLDLQRAVETFVWAMERKRFVTWEAVIRQEQGLPLSQRHRARLRELVGFGDDDDDYEEEEEEEDYGKDDDDEDNDDDGDANDEMLYIDERPRPSEPV